MTKKRKQSRLRARKRRLAASRYATSYNGIDTVQAWALWEMVGHDPRKGILTA